ncbi:MAG: (4Fe-4S)-binding protein [Prevotellaceae bacterium]|nr:(4Fe-4S)-binding protein [Prevotellaceae bacterium]
MTSRKYTNGEITVEWTPRLCAHAALCWKNLPEVFNPHVQPWINMEGASSERIAQQVDKCPSGALRWYRNDGKTTESTAETPKETVVEVHENGPLIVHGNIKLKKADGSEQQLFKSVAFCRCGASNNKPFCDGSHVKINFKG